MNKLVNDRVRMSTRVNYKSVWKTFNEFFIKLDVKPDNWEDRITLFAAYLVDQQKQSQTVRSYVSAIKGILRADGVEINENKFLLSAITRACKLNNDSVSVRLPIRKDSSM